MSIFHGMNTTASALSAQRLRMDVISSNMANADTSRARIEDGEWVPYRRKSVHLQTKDGKFSNFLQQAIGKGGGNTVGNGVRVKRIAEDTETPFKLVYDPLHQDADEDGYVYLPNIDPLREMVDLMSATRSYEANVTVFNANKGMMMKTLEIK